MAIVFSIMTGVLAGVGHVFAGPDHLAAVAPLAVDARRRTWLTGLLWGVGHSGGVWVLAALALLLREGLPINLISSWSERLVGGVLIAIGVWGLWRGLAARVHTHVHEHDGRRHAHIHVHAQAVAPPVHAPAAPPHERTPHAHSHSALGIGLLHGLAGTSHLLGVLPALLLPTRAAAVAYVGGFGVGAVAAMTLFAWVVGSVARRLDGHGQRAFRGLLLGSCVAAIGVGVFWIVSAAGATASHG
ncbi:High-affinity nickel-transport protein [Phycisphaerae bacterium RAS1]|nr:High-affinity nickel-transport protein [Phycisphaerae bacterium RAS1]